MPVLNFTFDASGVRKGSNEAAMHLERLLKIMDRLTRSNSLLVQNIETGFAALAKRAQDIRAVGEAVQGVGKELEQLARSARSNAGYFSGIGKAFGGIASIGKFMGGPYGMAASALVSVLYDLSNAESEAERTARRYGTTLADVSLWAERVAQETLNAKDKVVQFTEAQKGALRMRLDTVDKEIEEAQKKLGDLSTIKKWDKVDIHTFLKDVSFNTENAKKANEVYSRLFAEIKEGAPVTDTLITSFQKLEKELEVGIAKADASWKFTEKNELELQKDAVQKVLTILQTMLDKSKEKEQLEGSISNKVLDTAASYDKLAAAMEAASGKPQNYEQAIRLLDNLTGSTEEGRKATIKKTEANAAEAIALLERGAAAQFAAAAEAGLNAVKAFGAGDAASFAKNIQLQAEAFQQYGKSISMIAGYKKSVGEMDFSKIFNSSKGAGSGIPALNDQARAYDDINEAIKRLSMTEEEYHAESLRRQAEIYRKRGVDEEKIAQFVNQSEEKNRRESARRNLDVQSEFWRDFMRQTGRGWQEYLRANEEALQKRKELYLQAGIDAVAVEEWVQRQRAELARQGGVETEKDSARSRLESGDGSFSDGLMVALGHLTDGHKNVATGLADVWGNFFSEFSTGFSNSIGQAIVYSEDLGDALGNVARGALSSLISGLVQLGIQFAITQAMSKTMTNTAMAESTQQGVSQAATLAAAYIPAAIAVSLATQGTNAKGAMAGMMAAAALGQLLAVLPGKKEGGYTGNMSVDSIAGVVHGREYVFDAAATSRIGVPALEALRSGRAFGNSPSGTVGGLSASAPNASGSGAGVALNVSIENYGTGKEFSVEQLSESEIRIIARDEARDVVRSEAPRVVASNIANPNSEVSKAMGRNIRAERRRP